MSTTPVRTRRITLTVNGQERTCEIEDRQLLVEVIRERLGLTGTHIGCLNGDCGACTIELSGKIVKSCLVLAASADGEDLVTIEGLSGDDEALSDIQQSFWEHDALQCGFCAPGHLFAIRDLLANEAEPDEQDVRDALVGNLCRCTGYVHLVKAALAVAADRREAGVAPTASPCAPAACRLDRSCARQEAR